MTAFRYSLGKIVGICPQCGRRTFKPYVDNATGAALDAAACGRCNRQNSCGYHMAPARYFALGGRRPAAMPGWTAPPPPRPDFMGLPPLPSPSSLVADNLFNFLCGRFPRADVLAAFAAYRVHHSRWNGGATAFFLIDAEGRCRSAKLMRYGPDGHRLRQGRPAANVNFLHSAMGLKGYRFRSCFFGEHVAAARPDAPICLVESEKTALVMACRDPSGRFAYLATGGCSALNPRNADPADPYSRFRILRDRHVILYPDADMIYKWTEAADALTAVCRTVRAVDIRREPFSLTGSEDIGDYILNV